MSTINKNKTKTLEPTILNDADSPLGKIESESYTSGNISCLYIGTFKFDYNYKSSGDIPKKKTSKSYHPSITTFDAKLTTEYIPMKRMGNIADTKSNLEEIRAEIQTRYMTTTKEMREIVKQISQINNLIKQETDPTKMAKLNEEKKLLKQKKEEYSTLLSEIIKENENIDEKIRENGENKINTEGLQEIPIHTTLKQYIGKPPFKYPTKITLSVIERYLNYIEVKLDKENKLESGFQNDSIEFNYGQSYIIRTYILYDSDTDKYAFYQFDIYELLPKKSPPDNLYPLYNLRRVLKPDWKNHFVNNEIDLTPYHLVAANEDIRNEINTWYLNGEPFFKPIPDYIQSKYGFSIKYPPQMDSLIIDTYYSKNKNTKKKIDLPIPSITNTQCYDPIGMEILEIDDWLNENTSENIVLHLSGTGIRIATKKNIVLPRNIDENLTYRYNILYPCKNLDHVRKKIKDGTFDINDTYISLKYIGIPDNYIIKTHILSDILQRDTKQFTLTPTNEDKTLITEVELMNSLDAYPELYSKIYDKDEKNPGLYVSHGDEMAAAVHGYTYRWDYLINSYLRRDLNTNRAFSPDFLIATQRRIRNLDAAFTNAPRFQKETTLYRAISMGYNKTIDRNKIKQGIFPAYISTTYSEKYAYKFLNEIRSNSNKQINCCVFTYIVDEGVPYIPIAFSEGAGEQMEVLLPRDLELTVISTNKTNKAGFSEPVIRVSMPKQHALDLNRNICLDYQIATISEFNGDTSTISGGMMRRKTRSVTINKHRRKTRKLYKH